jgi:aminoglycoside 3-N-acetyltransferase
VLLLGVSHSENTALHLAEALAGVPYSVSHPCVVEVDGLATTVLIAETDHCCRGFRFADRWLRDRDLQREGNVGNAPARLCGARDLVTVAVEHLTADPLVFLCSPATGCRECDEARASIR